MTGCSSQVTRAQVFITDLLGAEFADFRRYLLDFPRVPGSDTEVLSSRLAPP